MRKTTRAILPLAAALSLGLALAPGGGAVSGTRGELVEAEWAFVGGASGDAPLGVGRTLYDPAWTIELEEARVVLGAAYVFPPPAVAARWGLPFVSTARAHAGDDNLFAVNALAEHRDQVVVDALSPEPTVVGPVLAESGAASIVTVWIDAPRGALAGADGPTHGHHGWVRGVARQGETELRFEAGLRLEDTPLSQRVDRIPLGEGAAVTRGSRVVVEALASEWLQQIDFTSLLADGALEVDPDGVARPTSPHPFQQAWLIDFHDPGAFRARIERGATE